ncbi:MAG: hypothetical protein R2726_23145 [Acidimicrobiales bacterium]
MGLQGTFDGDEVAGVGASDAQGLEPAHDAGRAEAALAGPRRHERVGPPVAHDRFQAVGRGDDPTGHPPHRRHTGDARGSVDEHRAAAALALRAAAVLRRPATQPVAQHLEQGRAIVDDGDLVAVNDE